MTRNIMKILAFLKRDFLSEVSYRVAFVFQIMGIFLSILAFYFVTGLLHSHLVRKLSVAMATEYAIVTTAGVALVVWARASRLA